MANPIDLPDMEQRTNRLVALVESGQPIDGDGGGPNDPGMELRERVARIEEKLTNVVPTLASREGLEALRADVNKSIGEQTWRIIGAVAALVLAVYFIARNVHP